MVALKPGPKRYLVQPRREQRGAQVSRAVPRPSPTGGWNARDEIGSMRPEDAQELINWFPLQSNVVTRPGYTQLCDTATGTQVLRLIAHEVNATKKLLAATGGKIYEVSTGSASSLATGLGSNAWSSCTLSTYTFLANGVDTMKRYDGSTIADATFTGVSLDTLIHVNTFKKRIFAVKKNTQSFWYGSSSSVTGALTEFNLGLTDSFRGELYMSVTISRDGGNGPDDFIVFIFSSGDAVVYQGSDPGDATNWSVVGKFNIGEPLSRASALAYGDDVIVLTTRGYESIKVSLPIGIPLNNAKLISDKIQLAVAERIAQQGKNDLWQLAVHSTSQMLIVNAPGYSTTEQHARNIGTKNWGKFKDLNATSWRLFDGKLYFGTSTGKVMTFGEGAITDNGQPINAIATTAFDYFGAGAAKKKHSMQQLIFRSDIPPIYRASLTADFDEILPGPTMPAPTAEVSSAEWDAFDWDTTDWSSDSVSSAGWVQCGAVGYATALRLDMSTTRRVYWNGVRYIFAQGGLI